VGILGTINKTIEVANNSFDTVQSIPEILREARIYAAEARGRTTITLGEQNRIVEKICQTADGRDRRVDELEIENRKLLDQNWSLVEERDACLADTERLNVQLSGCLTAAEDGTSESVVAKSGDYGWSLAYQATLDLRRKYDSTLRAKSEPGPFVRKGNPDSPGVGYEFCDIEGASECSYSAAPGFWAEWLPLVRFTFTDEPSHYRFRRPVAKPAVEAESQWVACTAEEAKNDKASEWFFVEEKKWKPVHPIKLGRVLSKQNAYRSTAELPKLVGHPPKGERYRFAIPVGTVLG
jgi:hypothetical protein